MKRTLPHDQDRLTGVQAANPAANLQNKFDMPCSIQEGLMAFASSVPDFRRIGKGNIRHPIYDIIMLLLLGRIAGKVARADIIAFGKYNLNKFKSMVCLRMVCHLKRLFVG